MELFRWGVASFDPRADSVLLWTRLPPGRGGAHWELASDPNFRDPLAGGDESTSAARNHTVCVDATGLDPGTTYWYRFRVGDTWSPVGRTRTLPAAPVERFRIGYVCCSRFSVAPLGVYRAMAEREVDLVVHLGDYIYEDDEKRGPRRHRPPRPAVTLDDYRTRIGQVREDPDCQALHMRHPMTVIWDDHDLADNAWRDGAKHHDEASEGPWPPRVEAAARARQEWLPSRLLDVDQPTRTWRSVPVGDLAELVLLDTRRERDRQPGDVGALPRDDPRRTMLGAEQRAWTAERLADVGRPWTILHTGVVMSELALRLPPIAALAAPAAQRLRGHRREGAPRRPVGRVSRGAGPRLPLDPRPGVHRGSNPGRVGRRPLLVGIRGAHRPRRRRSLRAGRTGGRPRGHRAFDDVGPDGQEPPARPVAGDRPRRPRTCPTSGGRS